MVTDELPGLSQTVVVARQPIHDASGAVAAHELLFRPSAGALTADEIADFDDDAATAAVLAAMTTEFDLREVAGAGQIFVNVPRSFVVGERPMPLRPPDVVLEVLERVAPDDEVRAGIVALRAAGFLIALDDMTQHDPRLALLDLADVVKVDLRDAPGRELAAFVAQLRSARTGLRLVAERIETESDLHAAMLAGFDLFQGYLLNRPVVMRRESLAVNAPVAAQLLALLARPNCSTQQLVDLVEADPAIAVKVLRAVTTVVGARERVSDLRQAVVLLGHERLHSMMVLEVVAGLRHYDPELPVLAVARTRAAARMAPERPLVAATEALVRLSAEMLGMSPQEADEWLCRPPLTPDVAAATEALSAYLDAADHGEAAQVPAPHTPLTVSMAWFAGLQEARRLLAVLLVAPPTARRAGPRRR